MEVLMIILIVLVYIAIGVAISAITHDDVLSFIVLFWVPLLICQLGREFANLVIHCIESLEDKMGE